MYALRERDSEKYVRLMMLFSMKANLDTEYGTVIVFDSFTEAYAASATLYFNWGGFVVGNPYFGSLEIVELMERDSTATDSRVDFELRTDSGVQRSKEKIWLDGDNIYVIHESRRQPVYWDGVNKCFFLDSRTISMA